MTTSQTGPRGRSKLRRHLKEAIRQVVRQAARDGRGASKVNVVSRVNRVVVTNVGESGSVHAAVSVQTAPVRQHPSTPDPSDRPAR